jgi:hypothetical protein
MALRMGKLKRKYCALHSGGNAAATTTTFFLFFL